MIPRMKVGRNPRGEEKLYVKLERDLPEQYSIFHDLEYASVSDDVGIHTGEVDFLMVHKEQGLLAIEVKGGDKIEFHPASGQWYSWDRQGNRFPIKDPFKQAKSSMHALVDKIRETKIFGKKGGGLPFPFGYSVSFPDAKVSCDNFPPECPREIVIDATDLPSLKEAVKGLFAHWAGRGGKPGMDDRQFESLLNNVLMPEYRVARSVGLEVQEEEEVLTRLTDEQCKLLDFLGEHNRALIEGYAGTGKTFLAVEKAKRLALSGKKVLLLCFNRPLADHLAGLIKTSGSWSKNVMVNNFHGLCIESAEEAKLKFEIPEGDRKASAAFWRDEAPLLLLDSIDRLGLKFDAVIVDEGQDFEEDWFDAIAQLFSDPGGGSLYIFYDPMQNIYHKPIKFPIGEAPYVLRKNCRNTRRIASLVSRISDISYEFPGGCVEGTKVGSNTYEDPGAQPAKIDEIVGKLAAGEVKPSQIVILSPHVKEKSCLAGRSKVGGFELTEDVLCKDPSHVRFSTLHRFKGLEADVVIFCDVDGSHLTCGPYHQYVSMSRAKHLLYILHAKSWEPPKGATRSC
jgi:hypothetical protein